MIPHIRSHIGLWIDHRSALIAYISDTADTFEQVHSRVEHKCGRAGDSPLNGTGQIVNPELERNMDHAYTESLNQFYAGVIERICKAKSILLFGPAEAKDELRNRLDACGLGGRIQGIETQYRMSYHQIAVKVRMQLQDRRIHEQVEK